jgi:endonuclease YncB( thermonuclease family)
MKTLSLIAASLVALMPSAAFADQVLSVGDGDTITVVNAQQIKTKVRLACIDAPEMAQKPAGPVSRKALQQLLPVGSEVRLRVFNRDRYGRTVAEVFKPGQPASVNLQMVSQGMAFYYRKYSAGCDQYSYGEAETGASVSKRGVWGPLLGYDLMFPWDYRACKRCI